MGVLELVAAPVSLWGFASDSQVWKFAMVAGRSLRAGSEATVTLRFSCNLSVSLVFSAVGIFAVFTRGGLQGPDFDWNQVPCTCFLTCEIARSQ